MLSIAGSDSGGGAGIQADIKAFAASGVHGMTAITAVTAQSTVGVSAVQIIDPEIILAQIRAVAQDIGVDAVKIGMLGTVATIEAVAQALDELGVIRRELEGPDKLDRLDEPDDGVRRLPVVLDPVMISESGAELLEPAARSALVRLLLPRATVITPNLPEALALVAAASGASAHSPSGARAAPADPDEPDALALARTLHALGPAVVIVTGGHRASANDVYADGSRVIEIPGERYPAGAAHGSGCTHSSVLAARLAWGDTPLQAARTAKRRASEAVRDGLVDVGAGTGPVDVLDVT